MTAPGPQRPSFEAIQTGITPPARRSERRAPVFGGILLGWAIALGITAFLLGSSGACLFIIVFIFFFVGIVCVMPKDSKTSENERAMSELVWLETTINDLNVHINAGQGNLTVTQMREAYQARASVLRQALGVPPAPTAPVARPAPAAPAARPAQPQPVVSSEQAAQALPFWSMAQPESDMPGEQMVPPAPARPAPASARFSTLVPNKPPAPAAPPPPVAQPVAPAAPTIPPLRQAIPIPTAPPRQPEPVAPLAAAIPVAPAEPAGPVFSWRAFAAEQSLRIMFYLGGLAAIAATIVSLRAELKSLISLGLVLAIYIGSLVVGIGFRRSARLRPVSRTYLGLFSLMTPLIMLGLYLLLPQNTLPVAGLVCLAGVYTGIVYLALGVETRFSPYVYVGWAALATGGLAIVPWIQAPLQWWAFTLGLILLVLLVPRALRSRFTFGPFLAEPATQIAVVATVVVMLAVQVLGIIGLTELVNPNISTLIIDPGALALSACILVPITVAWRRVMPGWKPGQSATIIDIIDGFNAVFFAEAVSGVTLWITTDLFPAVVIQSMAVVFAALALVEFGLALRLRAPRRVGLRYALEGLALILGTMGTALVASEAAPNWPLIVVLSAILLVMIGIALSENRWWLLLAGAVLALDYYRLVLAIRPDALTNNAPLVFLALTLALWLAALAFGFATHARRFALPTYIVALGIALYTCTLLTTNTYDATYQMSILLTLTVAAFIGGLRERTPDYGSVIIGFFGVLALLPFTLHDTNGLDAIFLALGFVLATPVVRRFLGRAWTVAPAGLALLAVVLAVIHASLPGVGIPEWADWEPATGLPFMAWFLLFVALIAYGMALWERQPLLTIIPGTLAFWAVALTSGPVASPILIGALIAVGAALQQWRRRWWGAALYVVAVAGSPITAARLSQFGPTPNVWQVAFLLALAVAAYLVAVQERQPVFTALSVIYALVAVGFLPGPDNFFSSLVLTFALVAVAVAFRVPPLRARVRQAWALAPYGAAIGSSLFATQRGIPQAPAWVAIAVLSFAVMAYLVSALEQDARFSILSVLYALSAAWLLPGQDNAAFYSSTGASLPPGLDSSINFIPTIVLTFSLAAVGLALRLPPARARIKRDWAIAPYASAIGASLLALERGIDYGIVWVAAPLLGFAVLAYVAAALERQPTASILAVFYALSAAVLLPGQDHLLQFILTVSLTLATAAIGLALRLPTLRARVSGNLALAPYATAIGASLLVWQRGVLYEPVWVAAPLLGFAILAYLAALLERQPTLSVLATCYGLLAAWLLPDQDLLLRFSLTIALAFATALIGVALRTAPLRGRLQQEWAWAPYVVALWASFLTLLHGVNAPIDWVALPLLGYAIVAYIAATLEGQPALSALAPCYVIAAAWLVPDGQYQLSSLLALTFSTAAIGAALRLPPLRGRAPRAWGWAPYAAAVSCSCITILRVVPFDANVIETLLLVFAASAYLIVMLESAPLVGIVPAIYASAGALVQPNAEALLPLALIFAVLGLVAGRVAGIRWSWPFYIAATFAALMTAFLGQNNSGFEALALTALAVLAYVIAAVESRPDMLPVALILGVLALTVGINFYHLDPSQATLAFLGLSVLYSLGQFLWVRLPWLHQRSLLWWAEPLNPAERDRWRDPRFVGKLLHGLSGLLLAGGTAIIGLTTANAFTRYNPQTLVEATALLVVGGMLALLARSPRFYLALYVGGEIVALAITWVLRWLGSNNGLSFFVAPGSYLFLVGAFLPADRRVRNAARIGQFASLAGALLLVAPTLYLALPGVSDQNTSLVYVCVLGVEALVMIGLGLGTRSRLLILTGAGLVGLTTLGGAGLAIAYGTVSVPVILGVLAVLLIGGATWLNLRGRHDAPPPSQAGNQSS